EAHTYQQTVKKDIERDIQRRLQQMLGTIVGMDNVIVSVTADIDFTEENRVEELVEPVDIDDMEGLPVSIETIQESYSASHRQAVLLEQEMKISRVMKRRMTVTKASTIRQKKRSIMSTIEFAEKSPKVHTRFAI